MGFLKGCYGSSMVFLRDFHWIPLGISLLFLRCFYDISMEFLLGSYGISIGFLWDFQGISMLFLWYFYGIIIGILMGFL